MCQLTDCRRSQLFAAQQFCRRNTGYTFHCVPTITLFVPIEHDREVFQHGFWNIIIPARQMKRSKLLIHELIHIGKRGSILKLEHDRIQKAAHTSVFHQ